MNDPFSGRLQSRLGEGDQAEFEQALDGAGSAFAEFFRHPVHREGAIAVCQQGSGGAVDEICASGARGRRRAMAAYCDGIFEDIDAAGWGS